VFGDVVESTTFVQVIGTVGSSDGTPSCDLRRVKCGVA